MQRHERGRSCRLFSEKNSDLFSNFLRTILILVCAPQLTYCPDLILLQNKFIQTSFVSAMGVPAMVVLPFSALFPVWGILNNVAAGRTVLIILYVGINVPYTTIFLLTFFSNISRTYEEAAAMTDALRCVLSGKSCSPWHSQES